MRGTLKSVRTGRSFLGVVLELTSTANGVLLVVQAVLAQSPYDAALPPIVYAWVNASVVLLPGIMRISAILLTNAIFANLLGFKEEPLAEAGDKN